MIVLIKGLTPTSLTVSSLPGHVHILLPRRTKDPQDYWLAG